MPRQSPLPRIPKHPDPLAEAGIEPARRLTLHRILSPVRRSRKPVTGQEIREPVSREVPVLVPSPTAAVSGLDFPPDLGRVVAAWPDLSDAIKAGILALVHAGAGS